MISHTLGKSSTFSDRDQNQPVRPTSTGSLAERNSPKKPLFDGGVSPSFRTLATAVAAAAVLAAGVGSFGVPKIVPLTPIAGGAKTSLDETTAAAIEQVSASLFGTCSQLSVAVVAPRGRTPDSDTSTRSTLVYTHAWGSQASFTTKRQWGSVSKVATALAAMRLVERGELSLDRPIWEFGPGVGGLVPPERRKLPITLEHLLTHRAGLTHEKYRGTPQMFYRTPGKKYHYSSNGYGVVGLVLAERSGASFDEVIRREIGEPSRAPSLSAPSAHFSAPAALVRSSIRGFGAFAAAVVNGGIVTRETLLQMTDPRALFTDGDSTRERLQRWWNLAPEGYGLGFEVRGHGAERVAGHTGKNGRKRAFLVLRAAKGQAVAAFCDARRGQSPDWWRFGERIFAALPATPTG